MVIRSVVVNTLYIICAGSFYLIAVYHNTHQKTVQSGDMATATPREGIVGTSTAQHSFTGNKRLRRNQIKSIFVCNGSTNTTVA